MINSEKVIERRCNERFQVQQGVYALLKNGSSKLGQIKNISKGGLAFMYINDGEQIHEPTEVDIFLSGMGSYIQDVKSKTISDFRIDKKTSNSSLTIRQCGMQFRELTNSQTSQINDFIKNFADRRSAEDRRELPSLQYSGPERRRDAERRKMIESPF